MSSLRNGGATLIPSRSNDIKPQIQAPHSEIFGMHVFNQSVMEKMLPSAVLDNLRKARRGEEKLSSEHADTIAMALRDWAQGHGATHYTHWFQPLTGKSAEKHDSFLSWDTSSDLERVLEHFSGEDLIQGEPDASSFPSGGLRSTYEARGYTGWDPSSYPFLWTGGDGVTLCIPSVFFSWTGEILDTKLPFLRSEKRLKKNVMRLLRLTGIETQEVFATLGFEQEYFVVDRNLRNAREDLVILDKTVCGASPAKGQELQDHYFGPVKDRILRFMRAFEQRALQLGIPVKTRHNEVAPAQHEIAPVFERGSLAVDHNLLLMELMNQIAPDHGLSVLFHEKPFKDFNGSGKHANWSMSTSEGLNLLSPSQTPQNSLHFLVLLVAILDAVHSHNTLFRAAIGTASNDDRLGGHEAPPAIISVYLGQELERLLDNLEQVGSHTGSGPKESIDLGLEVLPCLRKDHTDRNRTSPIAFTGNKFEIRAVGSSQNPSFAITVLHATVASSLEKILYEVETYLEQGLELTNAVYAGIHPFIIASKRVRYSHDNYSKEWAQEAKARGLPEIPSSLEAYHTLLEEKTADAFRDVLNKKELASRFEILTEQYLVSRDIEIQLLLDLFSTKIYPCALKDFGQRAQAIRDYQAIAEDSPHRLITHLKEYKEAMEKALEAKHTLATFFHQHAKSPLREKSQAYATQERDVTQAFRNTLDTLEKLIDDDHFSLPKYRELLWLV